ncbi:MAG TPA: cell division protein FtsA [Desulfobacterales bacterium]|nr:cell division protein FtsA [Desulfobacterales bacterium]
MARHDTAELIVGLDIGTTKICVVVGEVNDGKAEIIGMGVHPSIGLRKGVVVNIDSTVKSIKRAVEEAEMMANCDISTVYVGIAGSHIKGFNSHGLIPIKNEEVTRDDIGRVVEAARAVPIPQDQKIIHVLPQEFTVDDQSGIQDPQGMTGVRLEADVHIVTGASTAIHNIVKCCNVAGLEVANVVLEQLASAAAILTPEELELGVALLDIGGGTSDLAIFFEGTIKHTYVLGLGGNNLTNDLSIGLRTPMKEAERLKELYGSAISGMIDKDQAIEVPSVGGRNPRRLSQRVMGEILEPRIEEMLTMVNQEMNERAENNMLYKEYVNAGVVITGGTALLANIQDLAEQIFDQPVRLGNPTDLGGVTDIVNTPQCATGVGLVLYGLRNRNQTLATHRNRQAMGKISSRLKGFLGKMF